MKKRNIIVKYKVIADYPFSPFEVGKIIELHMVMGRLVYIIYTDRDNEIYMTPETFNQYPHIFQPVNELDNVSL